MSNAYPELIALQNFIAKHTLTVFTIECTPIAKHLIPMRFSLGSKDFDIHINDEYNDLDHNNPLLTVVLALYEFLIVEDSDDFLTWCSWQNTDPNTPKLLTYYKNMCNHVNTIKPYFPEQKVTAFVSDLDFQLNSGCMYYLRAGKNL